MTDDIDIRTTPTRPYMTRAIYQWIEDNHLTPYLVVDATFANVMVPMEHVKDGQIVLNISSSATHKMSMANDAISFSARFGGVSRNLYIPFPAVLGIYAKQNGQGMFFDASEYADYTPEELENGIDTETVSQVSKDKTAEKTQSEREERLEKAKKSGFRVIE